MPHADALAPVAQARVLLVDDHALLRTGVANIINQEPDLHVIAEAANGADGVDAFRDHRPDVTLLDLRMPVMEGVEAVRHIREIDPQARVIVLTTYDADEDIARALQAGAKAYVLKDISADALIACIHDVLAGKTYVAPAVAAKRAERVTRIQLTPRELSTLRYQRTHGQDAPGTPVREAGGDQPDRGREGGHQARSRPSRLAGPVFVRWWDPASHSRTPPRASGIIPVDFRKSCAARRLILRPARRRC
jgi:two-component system NarL family response regulator